MLMEFLKGIRISQFHIELTRKANQFLLFEICAFLSPRYVCQAYGIQESEDTWLEIHNKVILIHADPGIEPMYDFTVISEIARTRGPDHIEPVFLCCPLEFGHRITC